MTTINADLFRITYRFTSREETRFYLQGVCVEKHPDLPGALLVATDGHRAIVIHDATADVTHEGQMIVQADKAFLAATKTGRGEVMPRVIRFSDSKAPAEVVVVDRPVALMHKWLIDGTFPAWRRVMPGITDPAPVSVNASLLADFIKTAAELDGPSNAIRIEPAGDGAPMRVLFAAAPHIMGILMPYRWAANTDTPAFLPQPVAPEPVAEAAE